MPPRNHKNWLSTPKVEYISSECYNNYSIFEQENELIFSKVWVPMCHISEMCNDGDFRSTQIATKCCCGEPRRRRVRVFVPVNRPPSWQRSGYRWIERTTQ